MRIYIDFDDVLCETALAFTKIAKQMFGIDVPYREVQFFNLKKTFDLTDSQYEELMKAGHFPDNLLKLVTVFFGFFKFSCLQRKCNTIFCLFFLLL